MSQAILTIPGSPLTMSGLASSIDAIAAALASQNSGAVAPVSPVNGMLWFDTSNASQYACKVFEAGAGWLTLYWIDRVNNVVVPAPIVGIGTLPSAATVDIGSLRQAIISITGTTAITSLGTSAQVGQIKVVQFSGILTLTNSSNIVLPGGINITTAAGDVAVLGYLGAGVWKLLSYSSGSPTAPTAADGTNTNQLATCAFVQSARKVAPTFAAYQSAAQTLSGGTWTRLNMQTVEWATNDCFDVTNSRFYPNVAGYYLVSGMMALHNSTETALVIYKNSSGYRYIGNILTTSSRKVGGSAMVYMNGTSDYVELYGYSSSTLTCIPGAGDTYFTACLMRPS